MKVKKPPNHAFYAVLRECAVFGIGVSIFLALCAILATLLCHALLPLHISISSYRHPFLIYSSTVQIRPV